MGIFQKLFGRKKLTKLLYLSPSDSKMYHQMQATRTPYPSCDCLSPQFEGGEFKELVLHNEPQDTNCDAWKILTGLIAKTEAEKSKEFAPGLQMQPEQWQQIVKLPASIGRLKSVKRLYLYGSNLIQIPIEIGDMENLEEFDVYTSYRLHWIPYEITRCKNLKRSRVSTRALYGNYKYRPPFPFINSSFSAADQALPAGATQSCSICGCAFSNPALQVWISLRVATDILPLLVNACSEECIRRLPHPATGYVNKPHKGGLRVSQPSPSFLS